MSNPLEPLSLLRSVSHALLALGLTFASLESALTYIVILAFAEIYGGLAHVPAATSVLLRFHWVLLFLPLPVIATWWLWPNRGQRGTVALITGIAVAVVSEAMVRIVLYLPLFDLGK